MSDYIEREAALSAVLLGANRHQMAEYIADIPAADVRPVVRGKWVSLWIEDDEIIGGGYTVPQCSVCKEDSYGTTPFCPFCGASIEER